MNDQQKLITAATKVKAKVDTGDVAKNYSPEGHDAMVTRDL
jgi:hypothetical protein